MTKKTLYFDAKKCVGCYACAVACMDQNDIDLLAGDLMFRHVFDYYVDCVVSKHVIAIKKHDVLSTRYLKSVVS